jgi:AcrR family transcriptional regulator
VCLLCAPASGDVIHDIVIHNGVMYGCQVPRAKNPDVAARLIDAAARVLAEEGHAAVTARRLASEIGASTMAVYTHFGSMEDVLVHVWREGFARFGAALDGPATTDDPVADWLAQGWAYRRFALENRHLYRVMFGGVVRVRFDDPADQAAAAATFTSLLARLQRAVDAGRLAIADVALAGQVVWSTVHGQVMIELDGYGVPLGHDAVTVYGECMRRLALGFGDDPAAFERSFTAASGAQPSINARPSAQAASTRANRSAADVRNRSAV